MNKFIQTSLLVAVVALCAVGCRHDNVGDELDPNASLNPEALVEDGFMGYGDTPMNGVRFETLPRVEAPAEIQPVYFAYNVAALAPAEAAKLGVVADFLAQNPGVVLVVEGNCDERGTAEYNMSLGEYRSQDVRDRLIALSISADRIQTSSKGEENPVAYGHDENSWRLNRRAEFSFFRAK